MHNSGIEGARFESLDEGGKVTWKVTWEVTYEVTQGEGGLQAENVSKA